MPTTMRAFRADDQVWDICKKIAEANGESLSGLINNYLYALASAKVMPLEHVVRPDSAKPTIDAKQWERLQGILAQIVSKSVNDLIRDMNNPMGTTVMAKTERAQIPKLRPTFKQAPRYRQGLKARGHVGPLLDPAKCQHPENLHRQVLKSTYCGCGCRRLADGTWQQPEQAS